MDRNDVINLARAHGATISAGKHPGTIVYEGTGGIDFNVLERTVQAAVAAEREACAKMCESHTVFFGNGIELRKKMAAAIRMRSNKEVTSRTPTGD